MKKTYKAFSLIELSIVILIIGIMIAGVTQSSRLVKQFKLQTARNLTQNSPVSSIPNLALWYETSQTASFLTSERDNGKAISLWYDSNMQSTIKNNATQATTDSRPLFISTDDSTTNSLPAVRFDGTDDFLSFNGDFLIGTSYTVFIVEQVRASQPASILIGGDDLSGLVAGYDNTNEGENNFIFGGATSEILALAIAPFTTPTSRFHTFISSIPGTEEGPGNGKSYWMNGGSQTSDITMLTPISAFSGASIGEFASMFYLNGDISEIIMFTHALSTEERLSVEGYLSKKYNIKSN